METSNYSSIDGSDIEEYAIIKWGRDEDDGYDPLDENTYQRLKQNDPTATRLQVLLNCNGSGECFF